MAPLPGARAGFTRLPSLDLVQVQMLDPRSPGSSAPQVSSLRCSLCQPSSRRLGIVGRLVRTSVARLRPALPSAGHAPGASLAEVELLRRFDVHAAACASTCCSSTSHRRFIMSSSLSFNPGDHIRVRPLCAGSSTLLPPRSFHQPQPTSAGPTWRSANRTVRRCT